MTEAMPFLQKAILLSYDPRPFRTGLFYRRRAADKIGITIINVRMGGVPPPPGAGGSRSISRGTRPVSHPP